jgi:hypothetical protein
MFSSNGATGLSKFQGNLQSRVTVFHSSTMIITSKILQYQYYLLTIAIYHYIINMNNYY